MLFDFQFFLLKVSRIHGHIYAHKVEYWIRVVFFLIFSNMVHIRNVLRGLPAGWESMPKTYQVTESESILVTESESILVTESESILVTESECFWWLKVKLDYFLVTESESFC